MTDADKLLAVCRAVWPTDEWEGREDHAFNISNRRVEGSRYFMIDSLDDLRRVLLALNDVQGMAFNIEFDRLQPCPTPYGHLTTPTSTILDALHRAVCPE